MTRIVVLRTTIIAITIIITVAIETIVVIITIATATATATTTIAIITMMIIVNDLVLHRMLVSIVLKLNNKMTSNHGQT